MKLETIGGIIGLASGILGDVVAVSTAAAEGTVGAAALTSALATLGGTMTGGLIFIVAVPVVLRASGFGIFKLISRL